MATLPGRLRMALKAKAHWLLTCAQEINRYINVVSHSTCTILDTHTHTYTSEDKESKLARKENQIDLEPLAHFLYFLHKGAHVRAYIN